MEMKHRILVVDDEKDIRDLLGINLQNEGYQIFKAASGKEALAIFECEDISLMILDIMMPEMDGLEVCRRVREKYAVPILMLSAKAEDMDKIQGILTGADDYVCKPFNNLELMVRVKALLRRAYYLSRPKDSVADLIRVDCMVIDKHKHRVYIAEREVVFTAREFGILYLLATNQGRVFSAEEIFEQVWQEKYYQSNNTVMVHMSRIREKIHRYTDGIDIIHTV